MVLNVRVYVCVVVAAACAQLHRRRRRESAAGHCVSHQAPRRAAQARRHVVPALVALK